MSDSALRNSVLNLGSTAVSMACGFVASVVVARQLGADGLGATAFGFLAVVYLTVIVERGYSQSILRFAAQSRVAPDQQDIIRASFDEYVPIVVATFLAVLLLALTSLSWGTDGMPLFCFAAAVLFLTYSLAKVAEAASRGSGDFYRPARNTVVGSLLLIPLSAIGVLFLGPAGALLALAARFLPQVLDLCRLVTNPNDIDAPGPNPLGQAFQAYRAQMWLVSLLQALTMSRLDYLFLLFLVGVSDVGLFAVAIVFSGLVSQLALQLSSSLTVKFVRAPTRGHVDAWLGVALFFLPVAMIGSAILPGLIPQLFGVEFADITPTAVLLLLAAGVSAIAIVPWSFLAATGHAQTLCHVSLVSACLTLVVAPLAFLFGGIEGLAWARLAIECVTLAILIYHACVRHGMEIPATALATLLSSSLTAAIAAVIAYPFLPAGQAALASIVIALFVYLVMLRLTRSVHGFATYDFLRSKLTAGAKHRPVQVHIAEHPR